MRGTFSPPTASNETANQRSRHASWHVRHACAVMHVGIANPRRRGKRSRHSRRMRSPQFYYLARGAFGVTLLLHIRHSNPSINGPEITHRILGTLNPLRPDIHHNRDLWYDKSQRCSLPHSQECSQTSSHRRSDCCQGNQPQSP